MSSIEGSPKEIQQAGMMGWSISTVAKWVGSGSYQFRRMRGEVIEAFKFYVDYWDPGQRNS